MTAEPSDPPRLPESPDFDRLEEAGAAAAKQRAQVVTAIGNLIFSWSNNESVFLYFLMELLDTDFSAAAITFTSLNTTRARLDLVRRLGKARIRDPRLIRRLERLIERFNDCTKIRNEFNHCIYQMSDAGEITHTSILRITEKKTGVQIAEVKPVDAKRFEEIGRTIEKLNVLNRDLWSFLPELAANLRKPAAATTSAADGAPPVDTAAAPAPSAAAGESAAAQETPPTPETPTTPETPARQNASAKRERPERPNAAAPPSRRSAPRGKPRSRAPRPPKDNQP